MRRGYPPTVSVRERHIILIVVAVIVAGTSIRLGFWQLHRLQAAAMSTRCWRRAGPSPTVPIGSLAPDALPYHHVTATGEYDPTHDRILSGRSQNKNPGNHVLTPLLLGDGTAVIVDRSSVPWETTTPPVTGAAAAPAGRVTVTGLALPPDQVPTPRWCPPRS